MVSGIPIAHFEAKYEIYPDSRIWNRGNHTWKQLSQNSNGYWKVTLALNGVQEQLLIHQLVALHFLPNPYKHIQVNHKDGIKSHNWVDNLEWISSHANIQHSLETGLRKGYMSLDDKISYLHRVLAGEQVKEIAAVIDRRPETLHKMLREVAAKLNLSPQWDDVMKVNRKNAALQQLAKINVRHTN